MADGFKNTYLVHNNFFDKKQYNHDYYLRNKEKWKKYYKGLYRNNVGDHNYDDYYNATRNADYWRDKYDDVDTSLYPSDLGEAENYWARNQMRTAKDLRLKERVARKRGLTDLADQYASQAAYEEENAARNRKQAVADSYAMNARDKAKAQYRKNADRNAALVEAYEEERERYNKTKNDPVYQWLLKTKKKVTQKMNNNPYIRHSWGTKPEQKAREKQYNHAYYLQNKEKWKTIYASAAKKVSDMGTTSDPRLEGAEARLKVLQKPYMDAQNKYRHAADEFNTYFNSIPKQAGSRTKEQDKMLDKLEKKMLEAKNELSIAERNFANAQNDIKNINSDRDMAVREMNRIGDRYARAQKEYDDYVNSEAGESEQYRKDMNMLKNRRDKNWERYGYYESQAATPDVQKQINDGTWTREKYLKEHGNLPEKAEQEALKAEKDMKALMSKRRASAMARTMQAHQQAAANKRQAYKSSANNQIQQINKDTSIKQNEAASVKNAIRGTQSRIDKLVKTLEEGMSRGYTKTDSTMQRIAEQIKKEQATLSKQNKRLADANAAINALKNKAKSLYSNL